LRAEVREMKFALSAFAGRGEVNRFANVESDTTACDSPNYETYLVLTGAGLPPKMASEAVRAIPTGVPASRNAGDGACAALVETLPSWVQFAQAPLAIQAAAAFVGPTGVGKTTTIAKLAARIALRARQRVELITLDTYRIAAVHQLKTYAEIIGAG